MQRWLYANALQALDGVHHTGISGLPSLMTAAFIFGLLHALLPGHGKSAMASYYAGEGRMWGAVGSSALLIVTHVGSAIILVLCGFAILQRTITGAGRAPVLEQASQLLIMLVGLWLLWRAIRPHDHGQGRSAPALAVAAGLVPCPLTTFIMSFAAAKGMVAWGLVLSVFFAAGMVVTVAVFPLIAVLLRLHLLPLITATEQWRRRIGHSLEILAALAVILLGLWPLLTGMPMA